VAEGLTTAHGLQTFLVNELHGQDAKIVLTLKMALVYTMHNHKLN
jgi:hypothetical protein